MPEGTLCNKKPVNTREELDALLGDKGGKLYYEELNALEVDMDKLKATFKNTLKSRTRTWLDMCAHCGLCADSCFLYNVNKRDPKQVPSYKIQTTLGEMVRRVEKNLPVDNEFMRYCMDTSWSKCTCCNRCGSFCPYGIDMGVMFSYLRGVLNSQGFVPWELKIGSGMHRIFRAQMDVTSEDWVETCEWMAEESEDELAGSGDPHRQGRRGHLVHLQRPRAQALSGRPGRGGHPLPHHGRKLDRAEHRLGTDQPVHVRGRLGSLQNAGGNRVRRHRTAQAQARHRHRVRPRPPGNRRGRPVLGRTQGRQPARSLHPLRGMGARGLDHGPSQDRPGQTHQGQDHLPGFLQLHPQPRPG